MKILAPESTTVSRSLRRVGLSGRQVRRLLNRTLLCLNFIGPGKRVSIEIFKCFSNEVRVKGHRLRFNQVLCSAGLLKQTSPHIQGLVCSEYRTQGRAVNQEIKLTRAEAQIPRKVAAERLKASRLDETLQWLCKAVNHHFEDGRYIAAAKIPEWHSVALERAFAGIVAEAIRRQICSRYFRQSAEDGSIELDNGEEGRQYRKSELSADFQLYTQAAKFADSLSGRPSSIESLRGLDHRIEHLAKSVGFEFLKLRFEKNLVEGVVARMREKNILCCTDGVSIYAEDAEALETAFINEVQYQLCVDVTEREKPILTPLYIDRLRRLKARKEGVNLKSVPRAKPKHWKAPKWMPSRKITVASKVLATVDEAKAFYGVDPEADEAEAVSLHEARQQIEKQGSIKASNSQEACRQLEDMNQALPVGPTRQIWELTEKGRRCLLDSQVSPGASNRAA